MPLFPFTVTYTVKLALKVQNPQGDEWEREMDERCEGDGWEMWGRWVRDVREMGERCEGDEWEMWGRWVRDVREMGERCEGDEWEISERCERDPRYFDKHGTTVQLWTDRVCFGLVSPHQHSIARNIDSATSTRTLIEYFTRQTVQNSLDSTGWGPELVWREQEPVRRDVCGDQIWPPWGQRPTKMLR